MSNKFLKSKFKYHLKVKNGREIINEVNYDDSVIDVYGSGGVFKYTDRKLFAGPSVLFGRKGTIGKPLYVEGDFWTVDTMYYTEIYPGNSARYFYYLLEVFPWNRIVTQTALPSIVGSEVENYEINIPNENMQKVIAKYLDSKCEEINKLIKYKERLITFLEQQRQSIITEAVTKGLNPKVKMKDSGVEWVNEIPEHWTQKKIKYLVDRVSRDVRDEDEVITAFRDGQVTLRKNRREDGFTFSIKEIGYQGIRKGDLVVHQMDAFAGAIGVSESDGKASPVYTVCIPKNKKEIHVPFLCEVIRVMSNSGYIESLAKGIRERSTDFRWKDMGELASLVPPISEQIEIANTISRKSQEIKMLIQLMKKDIEKLKEYRQALIYEAVTGKIDVRDMELD